MNLECPTCHAAYDVPEHLLGARRVVRCGTCNHAWALGNDESAAPQGPGDDAPEPAESDPPAAAAPVASVVAPDQRLAPPRPSPAHGILLTGAWLASFALIMLLGSAAYAWRDDVVRAWPPAGRILAASPGVAMLAHQAAEHGHAGHGD